MHVAFNTKAAWAHFIMVSSCQEHARLEGTDLRCIYLSFVIFSAIIESAQACHVCLEGVAGAGMAKCAAVLTGRTCKACFIDR